jgi:hypothetical protein
MAVAAEQCEMVVAEPPVSLSETAKANKDHRRKNAPTRTSLTWPSTLTNAELRSMEKAAPYYVMANQAPERVPPKPREKRLDEMVDESGKPTRVRESALTRRDAELQAAR